jgi:glycosyltransferase involved in cell wall biosynthesis
MERLDPNKIAFIYVNGHPNTMLLVDYLGIKERYKIINFFSGSIKNTIKSMTSLVHLPKNYDIYLIEGNFITPIIARKLRLIQKNAKIIKYLGEPIFYRLLNGQTKGIKKKILDYFLKDVDAFICHGDWQVELLTKYLPNAKKMMVYTPILPEVFEHFTVDNKLPDLNSHNILLIGNGTQQSRVKYKGLDLAVNSVETVRKTYPDTKLNIIGKWDKKTLEEYKKYGFVKFLGYVPDLLPYIKDSALYLHPARGEAFGLSIVEAMLGGLPAIVSNETGAKTVVSKVDSKCIVDTTIDSVSSAIIWYFSLKPAERLDLSRKSKKTAESMNPKIIIPKFKRDFEDLVKSLINE